MFSMEVGFCSSGGIGESVLEWVGFEVVEDVGWVDEGCGESEGGGGGGCVEVRDMA